MRYRHVMLMLLFGLPAWPMPAIAGQAFDVLAYHDVRDDVTADFDRDQYAISTRNLIDHFTWLKLNGYVPVSIDDLIAARDGRAKLPEKAVLITFDDGFSSVYTHVFPLLKLFGYPAVVSLVTNWIEHDPGVREGGRLLTRDDFLTWAQVAEMQASGLVEIASHSHDLHRGVPGNPQGNLEPAGVTAIYGPGGYEDRTAYNERIRADLSASARLIEAHTGRSPRVVTWPYGAYNDALLAAAAENGMTVSMTLEDGKNHTDDLHALARHLIEANAGIDELAYTLLYPPSAPLVRAAQVDLDYVYDEDPAAQERNLGALLDRIQALEITHVFLQAFADPDSDGAAEALYFPNRYLPMRSDLFNRAAWQLKTRANVQVYAWLPMLGFKGLEIDGNSYVLQYRDGSLSRDTESEPRLSPFAPHAVKAISGIYEDLAIHASFDGLLFHDDGRLSDIEDASAPAMRVYREKLGAGFDFAALESDPALRARWGELKTATLIDLSRKLARVVRAYRPAIKTARNLFAPVLLDDDGPVGFGQDYAASLGAYDYVAVMAMPYLEGEADPDRFYARLAAAAGMAPDGLSRTIFELQTVDWRDGSAVPAEELRRTMRRLQSMGVRNLAYYPDDFIEGLPELETLRQGISVASFPRGAQP